VHVTAAELEAGLDYIRESPTEKGTLDLIVCRPAPGERRVLEAGELDLAVGLVGDDWHVRVTRHGPPDPLGQLNIMNARAAQLVAGSVDRWPLAGDQLYVDFDLSTQHLPAGAQLAIGDAIIEITAKPHRGCAKFTARFGAEATRFINTGPGIALNLRGRNARVVQPGTIRRGDTVKRLA
jgi:MOSC domain-containing protein YiiM